MSNPEQPVLDEIDHLVEWQMDEGRKRGDGPFDPARELFDALFVGVAEVVAEMAATADDLPVLRPGIARRRTRDGRDPWRWDRQRRNTSWKASQR